MPSRKSKKWQSRRKPSLGQLRRAHPASGATWNVQVVRGKMTSKCLWHACRALIFGIMLMLLGAGMATVGYYADQLSVAHEIRGNATVRVKNESRGFHLNNLSYVGPIVMGFGGFIVVAACVMTFEARDSAAKVVPARFKLSNSNRSNIRSNSSSANSARRANGIMHQATRWDHHLGVFRTSPAEPTPQPPPMDRQALTAALVHFSKTLNNSPRLSPKERRFSHSGSVPNLTTSSNHRASVSSAQLLASPHHKQLVLGTQYQHRHQQHHHSNSRHHRHHHHHHRHHNDSNSGRSLSKSRNIRISSSLVNRSSRDSNSSLLHPSMLQKMHRNATSVDETGPYYRTACDSNDGSLTSVIFLDSSHECRIRDRTRRSDTAKKHVFTRQKPIEKEELHRSPQSEERRRNSNTSDASYGSRYRRTSSASRTPSIDSRSVQVEMHSPEIGKRSPRTPHRFSSMQSSTPSVDREFRSQHSVCSEPSTIVTRQLSGQSSLEPCVLEEGPENEDIEMIPQEYQEQPATSKKQRPETLSLNCSYLNSNMKLFRSNSSRTHNRPKPKTIYEYETSTETAAKPIFDIYDNGSVEVVNEKRVKLLKTESESALQKSHLHLKNEQSMQTTFMHLKNIEIPINNNRTNENIPNSCDNRTENKENEIVKSCSNSCTKIKLKSEILSAENADCSITMPGNKLESLSTATETVAAMATKSAINSEKDQRSLDGNKFKINNCVVDIDVENVSRLQDITIEIAEMVDKKNDDNDDDDDGNKVEMSLSQPPQTIAEKDISDTKHMEQV